MMGKCKKCEEKKKRREIENLTSSEGLGDTVSKFIKNVTRGKIKECEPCKKRREALNKMFPYKRDTDVQE